MERNLERFPPFLAEENLGFSLSLERLLTLNENSSAEELTSLGGVKFFAFKFDQTAVFPFVFFWFHQIYHRFSTQVQFMAKGLKSDLENGLKGEEKDLEMRRKIYGENKYPEKRQKPFLEFLWEACQDTTLIILMGCALISLIAGMVQVQ